MAVLQPGTAAPDVSLIGQYAGGIFIYAISVLDAYRFARIRQALSETVNHADTKP